MSRFISYLLLIAIVNCWHNADAVQTVQVGQSRLVRTSATKQPPTAPTASEVLVRTSGTEQPPIAQTDAEGASAAKHLPTAQMEGAAMQVDVDSKGNLRDAISQDQRKQTISPLQPSSHATSPDNLLAVKRGIEEFDPTPKKSKKSHAKKAKVTAKGVELPPWLQILCAILVTLAIMGVYNFVKGRLTSALPRKADSERLHSMMQEAMEKVNVLKEQLDQRFDPLAVPEGEDPEVTSANRAQQRRDQDRSQEIQEAAAQMAEQKENLIAGANAAHGAFKEALETGRDKLDDFAKLESSAIYTKMAEASVERSIPAFETPEFGFAAPSEDEDFLTMPPLLYLLQGAWASASIRQIRYFGNLIWYADVVMLAISVAAFVTDFKHQCADPEVWIWNIGFMTMTALDLLARTYVIYSCDHAHQLLKDARELREKANSLLTGNGIIDAFNHLRRGSSAYFDAHFRLEEIYESWSYGTLQFLSFFNLWWGGFGMWVSVHSIIADTLACEAYLAVTWMHTYTFFYVMLLTWSLLSFATWIVRRFPAFTTPILWAAKSFDDDTMKGFPIALTLIESVVVKDSSNTLSMDAHKARQDVSELTLSIQQLEEKMGETLRHRERVRELSQQTSSEQEFMERSQRRVQQSLEQAKPLVGLVAANVRPSVEAGSEPALESPTGQRFRKQFSSGDIADEAEGSDVDSF